MTRAAGWLNLSGVGRVNHDLESVLALGFVVEFSRLHH
ncbi:hypothetical protein ACVW17_001527 [Bradyrhizobium sp. USDA 4473]